MSQTVKLDIPEFLNIGIACTSAWVGTAKENNVAMIIEDDKLGTDKVTYKRISYKIRSSFKFSYSRNRS